MITRKTFLKLAATVTASSVLPQYGLAASDQPQSLVLRNSHFELALRPKTGLQCRLIHKPTDTLFADGLYSYSFGEPSFSKIVQGESAVTLFGTTANGIDVEHNFRVDPNVHWIEEKISIRNSRSQAVILPLRCGFVLPVGPDTLRRYVFTATPYRREPNGDRHQYADYSLEQILYERRRSRLREDPIWLYRYPKDGLPLMAMPRLFSEDYVSEGWTVTDGKNGFLITKYNQNSREFAVLDRVFLEKRITGLRWGGIGVPMNDEEGRLHLQPGATHDFGVNRLTSFQGDLTQGYYAFRAEIESRGHRVPAKFDPPLQWNELYDNKLWWLEKPGYLEPRNREKFYSLEDMKEAAGKAQAIGCEALYLDPGWDTRQCSKIWDEKRLGKLTDFVAMLQNEYGGLKLSLHTPLAGWSFRGCDVISDSALITASGETTTCPCGTSSQYQEETVRRLRLLADAGVSFFMFDGTAYNMGECWDTRHGHSTPATIDEYVAATNRLARMVHRTHPELIIEMHDQVMGGTSLRYVPTYYGHGVDASGISGFDEVWAFELMWGGLPTLVDGNGIALYYYNLAYSLPLYLHFDLRNDNSEALLFWWYASTCRHLGIGGTHENPSVREAQRSAIATYRRLKAHFTVGTFFGIDEMTHMHCDLEAQTAVMNCFNIDDKPVEREIKVDVRQFHLAGNRAYQFHDVPFYRSGSSYVVKVNLAGYSHKLIEIN